MGRTPGENRNCRKVFRGKADERRKTERPRKRWIDGLEEDLKGIGVRGWRRKAMEGDCGEGQGSPRTLVPRKEGFPQKQGNLFQI